MVAQTIERTETRPTELTDQPAGLTAPESSAYVRGYSRGCLAYVRKHGGPSMVLEGPAPAAGTPARRQLAAELRTITTAHLIERHPAAHRAGMAALRKYRKTHGIAEPVAPAAPRKPAARKPRTLAAVPDPAPAPVDPDDMWAPVVRDETPAPAPVTHASFTRQYGSVTDTGPACANVDRISSRDDLEDTTGVEITCADCLAVVASVPAAPVESAPVVRVLPTAPAAEESTTEERRPNRTRRAARRQLAEDMRARGEDPTDAAAWAAAKLAAGVK